MASRLLDGMRISRPDGIVIGRVLSLRILHFFSGDIRETRWFREGAPAPAIPIPPRLRMDWLAEEAWRANPGLFDRPEALIAERFRSGARCLAAVDQDSGALAYHLWVTDRGAWVDWIFQYVEVPEDHLLIFDVWVHPDHRGGNLHWAGVSAACAEAARRGRMHICAGVEGHEFYANAMKCARTGIGLIRPYRQVLGIRVLGWTRHIRSGPSPALAEFSERLRAKYL